MKSSKSDYRALSFFVLFASQLMLSGCFHEEETSKPTDVVKLSETALAQEVSTENVNGRWVIDTRSNESWNVSELKNGDQLGASGTGTKIEVAVVDIEVKEGRVNIIFCDGFIASFELSADQQSFTIPVDSELLEGDVASEVVASVENNTQILYSYTANENTSSDDESLEYSRTAEMQISVNAFKIKDSIGGSIGSVVVEGVSEPVKVGCFYYIESSGSELVQKNDESKTVDFDHVQLYAGGLNLEASTLSGQLVSSGDNYRGEYYSDKGSFVATVESAQIFEDDVLRDFGGLQFDLLRSSNFFTYSGSFAISGEGSDDKVEGSFDLDVLHE